MFQEPHGNPIGCRAALGDLILGHALLPNRHFHFTLHPYYRLHHP